MCNLEDFFCDSKDLFRELQSIRMLGSPFAWVNVIPKFPQLMNETSESGPFTPCNPLGRKPADLICDLY